MSVAQRLSTERVESIFMDCLFRKEEDTTKHIKAEGITNTVGFHPGRLKKHQKEIIEMLSELSDDFKESSGGGMSFLNACNDKHGNQWTSFHRAMEQLFQLGIASGKAKLLMPRSMWKALPGGMPYYIILDK
ncbi:hypothetical protein H0W91_01755 [Patescibacteria group bacterium]|nr:hypothetical protein [Patescibacteria group bacterium]